MKTTRTARRTCIECSKTFSHTTSAAAMFGAIGYDDVCGPCYDYWGWENTHADEDHDNMPVADDRRDGCLVCQRTLGLDDDDAVTTPEPVATGRRNRSHAACSHPRTPAGRAACRKANA
jgi:hypothetical protein